GPRGQPSHPLGSVGGPGLCPFGWPGASSGHGMGGSRWASSRIFGGDRCGSRAGIVRQDRSPSLDGGATGDGRVHVASPDFSLESLVTERQATVVNSLGLHARPAAQFVKIAAAYQAEIEVAKDGVAVNAKSIMGVMMLAAEQGSQLTVRANGPDAE